MPSLTSAAAVPEIVTGSGTNVVSSVSIDIGSVRLTERILKGNPPDSKSIESATKLVQDHLKNISSHSLKTNIIGVAGTLTTLAALDLRIPEFDRNLINQHILTIEAIDRIFQELRPLTLDQLRSYSQIHPARADILLAGIIILRETLGKMNLSKITVSDRGLRYGIVIKDARMLSKHST